MSGWIYSRRLLLAGVPGQVHPAHDHDQRKRACENEVTVHRRLVRGSGRPRFLRMDDTEQSAGQLASSLERGQIPRWPAPRSGNNSARNDTLARKGPKNTSDRGAIAATRAFFRGHSLKPDHHSAAWVLDRSIQKRCDFNTREVACSRASDDHDLQSARQFRSSMPEPLSNTAFYAVADHCVAHPLADRDSQSMLALVRTLAVRGGFRCRHDDKTARNPAFPGFDHAPEILSPQDAVRPPKAARFRKHRPTSREYWLRGACGPSPGGA